MGENRIVRDEIENLQHSAADDIGSGLKTWANLKKRAKQRPSPLISVKVNPNYTLSPYLYLTDKGAPLPSHLVRTNAGPSSDQLRIPSFGDTFMGIYCFVR